MIDWFGLFISIAAIVLLVVCFVVSRAHEPSCLTCCVALRLVKDPSLARWLYHLVEQCSSHLHADRGGICGTHLPRGRGKICISTNYAP